MSDKPTNSGDMGDSIGLIPNWRNLEEYPNPKTTTPQEWAWEFLRRNNEYRADWFELHKDLCEINYYEAWKSFKILNNFDSEDEEVWAFETIKKANSLADTLHRKYGIYCLEPNLLPPPHLSCNDIDIGWSAMHNKVGIFLQPDPDGHEVPLEDGTFELGLLNVDDAESYNPERWMRKKLCEMNKSQQVLFLMNPRNLYAEISLEENIPAQINQLKKIATKQQEQLNRWGIETIRVRIEKDLYQGYLRCLDAHEVGANKKEISEHLLPGEPNEYPSYNANKKINNRLNRAKELRDNDYVELSKY